MYQRISLNGPDWEMKGYVGEDWLWRLAHKPDTRDWRLWKPASVPGSVQHDLWQAGEIPDPYQGLNSLAVEWVPERTWLYRKRFQVDPGLRGREIRLVFNGVDYSARYYLNGEELGRSDGLFMPARFDVSQKLHYDAENLLVVVIDPAPFEQPQVGYTSKVTTQKPRMNYWWDFCPRMVHLGIWDDVYLDVTGPVRIEDVWVQTALAEDFRQAVVTVSATMAGSEPAGLEIVLVDPAGGEVARQQVQAQPGQETTEVHFEIASPALWWPNGAGEQPLYAALVSASAGGEVSDSRQVSFGVRRIEFVPNEAADPQALPYTLVANGRRLYINGWNWVPMDVLYGSEPPGKRERLLRLAQQAHVNLLRVWGGGLIEKEAFYSLCDRLGILVWQEFTQSSSGVDNVPSEDPAFIDLLVRTAEAAIRARRNHPALAVWCGGNELHSSGEALCDDRHPALAALSETVRRMDPRRHWYPSSPSGGRFSYGIPEDEEQARRMHDVHGPWEYQGLRGHYRLYNQGESLLHSEFGVEGLTNRRALDATIPGERQWPVTLTNPVWEHLGAWWVKDRRWMDVFGLLPDVDAVQRATQFLQADGLRYAVEADRRRMYHNSGTLPWQFNEPYPMAACTSAVDYYAEPKPVYYTVARAYRPLTVTARFDTLAWGDETNFKAEIWCSNAGQALSGELVARVTGHGGRVFHADTRPVTCAADRSHALYTVELPAFAITGDLFFLDLALRNEAGDLLADNRYVFSAMANLAPLLAAARAQVDVTVEKDRDVWRVTLENRSSEPALWFWLEAEKADLRAARWAWFSDNYRCLLPGERRSIRVEWDGVREEERALSLSGWNFAGRVIR